MTHRFRLGRQPRERDPRFPHMSAIMAGRRSLVMPPPIDWSSKMPPDLGMMLNDQLGDCTCAAIYHLIQLWSFTLAGNMLTEPDAIVERAYQEIDGYVPGDPSTDQGGIMQHVMRYWLRNGVPMDDGVNKALAVVEVDPQNDIDIANAIIDCGAINIGFNVPAYLMPENGDPPPMLWDIDPNADNTIVGGHDVIAPGFNGSMTLTIVSWGLRAYRMTKAFRNKFVSEAYAIADPEWISARGTTPGGLTIDQLQQQMLALRA
ncbi:MAG TPA: hypothetical protein VGM38_02405 [Pseudolysinimonas sp.]|jgi:hypothetical protein